MTSQSTQCGCRSELEGSHLAKSQVQHADDRTQLHYLSVFHVPQMDCPSEENLIRIAFANFGEQVAFEFDIPNRTVSVYHTDSAQEVESVMKSVGLGASLVSQELANSDRMQLANKAAVNNDAREARVLKWLLAINAVMFVVELTVGIVAQSTGLIADSLDMFADAAVYGVAIYAVGKAAYFKLRAAHFSGWLQFALAIGVLLEVVRRFIFGSEPISTLMMVVGSVALVANITCLMLIFKSRNTGSHMKASWIFSANDVLANAGVILAGILVALTGSQLPDLVIGVVIACLILVGAVRILRIRN